MKAAILFASSLAASATAFAVNAHSSQIQMLQSTPTTNSLSPLRRATQKSPLFKSRDPFVVRGGAVPGWAAYNEALDKKPLTAKALTSLVGWALGDFLAQTFIGNAPFDLTRFITLSAFGFLYHGPSGHYFYNWLDSKITGTKAKAVFSKVAIDQLFWCPIFMTIFFTYLGVCKGDGLAAIGDKIKADLLTACQGSWKVWPLVHAVNFKFISTKHRLVFINGVQIAFNMFLSLIGSKK
uniref:Peroxisomal membrane protein MPV17 n=1 Tax=Corethron hystrix TaxID=216773 RepID=A0A7S1G146_9STRA|mmetsp:Transcript_5946/g.12642  ORF Transcript_5946/g.12642 Transcript_5946/m.12642 type:complete len:238 (+) Transcript_5946:124-837(+)|eukprot:CAMPEP_0113312986 /NCGR_PEP_ID=MMETSP0010_2-20120614/9591_1 /TAXON_ID=216773 ORGANISM="Corethron hystrix, Strain 308" /NCGR_SAMPLE_ID=MMETSP0010_2 /ASSEMBLY_ACC=CAM_ASM_000155 /LENGTH=237 /DNA_ID=CAMNT_0000168909 /DNA_START=57 /DNA_END=770 /DNA_ORIENTATION=- /assembly_acc=CAM_ASM_000155